MKALISATLLCASAAGAAAECTRTDRALYVQGWPEVNTQQRIRQPVTPDAGLECKFFPDQQLHENLLARYERGRLDGVNYRLSYADGSALIQGRRASPWDPADGGNWRLNCTLADQGRYGCVLRRGRLQLAQDAAGRRTITIGDRHRAGSEILLRVDRNRALTASATDGFSPAQVDRLLMQMRGGEKMDVGYHRDDLQNASETSVSLYGFGQALAIMHEVLRQLNSPDQAAKH